MARQPKPAPELERMILPRLRDEMACPPDLQVIRVDGRWEAFSEFIDKAKYRECLARVVLVAADLRVRYDLAD